MCEWVCGCCVHRFATEQRGDFVGSSGVGSYVRQAGADGHGYDSWNGDLHLDGSD